jgi:hypothetical protein
MIPQGICRWEVDRRSERKWVTPCVRYSAGTTTSLSMQLDAGSQSSYVYSIGMPPEIFSPPG